MLTLCVSALSEPLAEYFAIVSQLEWDDPIPYQQLIDLFTPLAGEAYTWLAELQELMPPEEEPPAPQAAAPQAPEESSAVRRGDRHRRQPDRLSIESFASAAHSVPASPATPRPSVGHSRHSAARSSSGAKRKPSPARARGATSADEEASAAAPHTPTAPPQPSANRSTSGKKRRLLREVTPEHRYPTRYARRLAAERVHSAANAKA